MKELGETDPEPVGAVPANAATVVTTKAVAERR